MCIGFEMSQQQGMNNPGLCILGGWPLCVEWASFGATIAPQDSFWHILL